MAPIVETRTWRVHIANDGYMDVRASSHGISIPLSRIVMDPEEYENVLQIHKYDSMIDLRRQNLFVSKGVNNSKKRYNEYLRRKENVGKK